MARIKVSKEIEATPQNLWAVLSDIGAVAKINPMVKSASASCEGEAGVGDTRVCSLRGGMRVEERVRSSIPNKSLEIEITGGTMPLKHGSGVFALEQIAPNRTRVDFVIEMAPKGGPLSPLMRLMMRPMLARVARGTLNGLGREVARTNERASPAIA